MAINIVVDVGPQGAMGPPGLSLLNGPDDPTSLDGVDGDFWINTTTNYIFGPKTLGIWGAGTSVVGPQGPQGTPGAAGNPGGANTQVQFNDAGQFNASPAFTFDKNTNTVSMFAALLATPLPVTSGGTGGATRSAALNNLLPDQASQGGKFLQSDGTNASWVANVVPRNMTTQWLTAYGTSLIIVHNWGTRNIRVEVLDNAQDYETITTNISRPSNSTVVVSSSEAPGTAWTVLLTEVLN